MRKYPVKLAERNRALPVRKKDTDAVEVIAPASRSSPFLSFRYSYTEMSVLGGKARVKSKNARFEDGKLTSETFEGELDRSAYDRAVSDAQRHIGDQMAQFLKAISLFLPFSRTHRSDRD
ncbi:MAG TPA: hypothetical protein VN326_12745 [Casimicrobiaceae bacterium]|jgi:hypothetical protein|nr:hypothetical protein [Casimicrobiaceae bacterium]